MEKYDKIRDDAFKMTYDALMEKIGDVELLKAVDILKDSPYETFGLVKGLRQETVAKLFPLVADGSWRVKEAYYCSNDSFNVLKPVPSFVNVESYKEWIRLKEKYPKGFDYYKDGRKAWDEYEKNYPDFWGDARMFDGHAEFRFGKIWVAPRIVTAHFKSETHEDIKEDELFLVIYEDSCNEFKKPMNTNPGICYVLTPNKESFDERRLEIYKYFKSHIVSAYVRLLMRKRDEEEAKRWRNELIHISNNTIFHN
jgi:hypothetical protein